MANVSGKIAKRYARALFELCNPSNMESVRDSLKGFSEMWETNPELHQVLLNPAFPISRRSEALRDIAEKMRSGDKNFSNFLVLLLENRRLDTIREIAIRFGQMIDLLRKALTLEISSAFEVPSSEKSDLSTKIKQTFGDLASVNWTVDSNLLGGLLIRSGDKQLDGTIKGALDKIQSSLMV